MTQEIIPAIMPDSYEDISSLAALVRHDVDTVQVDIMDGKFVPEKTWPFFHSHDHDLQALISQEEALPFWEDVNYELDLMVERPEKDLDTWMSLGASRVIFHFASVYDWDMIRNLDSVVRNFTDIGLGITIHDDLDNIYPLLDEGLFNFVQVMGIAHIGYQGEAFEATSCDIVNILHVRYPELVISVDGAVSGETIEQLHRAGATRFVAGSAIFGQGIAKENVSYLRNEIA